jgi:hypothetical protein
MNILLPTYKEFKPKNPFGSDQYGAKPPIAMAFWHHGVYLPCHNVNPKILTLGHSNKILYYVARKDQEQYLQDNGYKAKAIGMPICYVKDDQEYKRIPNSLLVMPMHTIAGVRMDTSQCLNWLKLIAIYAKQYDYMLVSLHSGDVANCYWINELMKLGIKYIIGANPRDENSLKRQSALFQQFETVVTNGYGSHCVYALYFGCKLHVMGKEIKPTMKAIQRVDTAWQDDQVATDYINSQTGVNEFLNEFRKQPTANKELGRYLVGYSEKNAKLVL